ncbi:hypothetical protein GCM10009839_58760 [Catenulispora yoronensis]|uniref:Uncharacterized protein n=1 Tax=Catenulispora yoronensis TaxID=450799 RepID=A0ABN2V0M6_9ACTN
MCGIGTARAIGDLDTNITDAFGILGVLLVFMAAYFAALWAQYSWLDSSAEPRTDGDFTRRIGQYRVLRGLSAGMSIGALLTVALTYSLSYHALIGLPPWHPYSFPRAALLLIDAFLILSSIGAARICCVSKRKRGEYERELAKLTN